MTYIIPVGDRFVGVLKFRELGHGGGDTLYECWGQAVQAAYAAGLAAERERCMQAACDAVAFNGGSVQMESHVREAIRKGKHHETPTR